MTTSKLIIGLLLTMPVTVFVSEYVRVDTITAKGKVDEGFIEIKCDPCDYNIISNPFN